MRSTVTEKWNSVLSPATWLDSWRCYVTNASLSCGHSQLVPLQCRVGAEIACHSCEYDALKKWLDERRAA